MVIKIYGSPVSTCARRVLTVCHEKDIPYEIISINFAKGEHKTAEFMKLQPFGKVPVMDDDGFILYESRAITRYLCAKYPNQGTNLMPDTSDLKAYALFEMACSLEICYFAPPSAGIAYEKMYKGWHGKGGPDEVEVAKHVAGIEEAFKVYNDIFGKQRYLAGEDVTLADLSHLPAGKTLRDLGHKDIFEKYPNVKRWWDELEARDSWKKLDQ